VITTPNVITLALFSSFQIKNLTFFFIIDQ